MCARELGAASASFLGVTNPRMDRWSAARVLGTPRGGGLLADPAARASRARRGARRAAALEPRHQLGERGARQLGADGARLGLGGEVRQVLFDLRAVVVVGGARRRGRVPPTRSRRIGRGLVRTRRRPGSLRDLVRLPHLPGAFARARGHRALARVRGVHLEQEPPGRRALGARHLFDRRRRELRGARRGARQVPLQQQREQLLADAWLGDLAVQEHQSAELGHVRPRAPRQLGARQRRDRRRRPRRLLRVRDGGAPRRRREPLSDARAAARLHCPPLERPRVERALARRVRTRDAGLAFPTPHAMQPRTHFFLRDARRRRACTSRIPCTASARRARRRGGRRRNASRRSHMGMSRARFGRTPLSDSRGSRSSPETPPPPPRPRPTGPSRPETPPAPPRSARASAASRRTNARGERRADAVGADVVVAAGERRERDQRVRDDT